ncbi:MAG: hypothetical protein BWZ03_00819 [bacterium ADurb.BinA186]|nr:MAG: hypothetical protein BWZ03_00819 [bacterium ADurb.BinA186]
MLKEQLLGLAIKAISRAHETKENLKKNLNSDAVQAYVKTVKDVAVWVIENRLKPEAESKETNSNSDLKGFSSPSNPNTTSMVREKKPRKTSIRPAKEIASVPAELILSSLKKNKARVVKKNDECNGKKSLAYLIWALGHADRAKIKDGISVHDVSALLYRAGKIELYPINISRVVHSNQALVRQVGQDKRTKTYLLTELGEKTFKEKFL